MNRYLKKLIESVKSPRAGVELILRNIFAKVIPDEVYIQIIARLRFGKSFDLKNPKTFNEKLNWLKLHDRNPKYTLMADKHAVKDYVREIIGEEYVVPCYGVYENGNLIDFNSLPPKFVLKCTHDSSGAIICKDRETFNQDAAINFINRCLKKNNFWHLREWVYKDISPRVIVDQLLDDGSGHELRDYKFWCFNGIPRVMYITNKAQNIYENFYDMDFKAIDINHGFKRQKPEYEKPKQFELMKQLASKLSKDIPFVRVDFFNIGQKVYFGEFTFYDWGGFRPFNNMQTDLMLGKMLKTG